MRTKYKGYIPFTDKEFETLWREATIVLDANVLLNLYRYTKSTQEQMLRTLERYKERLWLPSQSAQEFFRNRKSTISDQMAIYNTLAKGLCQSDSRKKVLNEVSRHLHIDIDELKHIVDECEKSRFERINEYLEKVKKQEEDYFTKDTTLETILTLFDNKVGEGFSKEEYLKACNEGKDRYKHNIPPGFKDLKEKSDDPNSPSNAYGDYVFWKEIITYAEKNSEVKSVIIITDDSKDDWWQKRSGKTIGPWPEMIQEFITITGKNVWIYKPDSFLRYSSDEMGITGEQKPSREQENIESAIEEISKYTEDSTNVKIINDIISMNNYNDLFATRLSDHNNFLGAVEIGYEENYIVDIKGDWIPSYFIESVVNELEQRYRIKIISFSEENALLSQECWIHLKSKYSKKELSIILQNIIDGYIGNAAYTINISNSSDFHLKVY